MNQLDLVWAGQSDSIPIALLVEMKLFVDRLKMNFIAISNVHYLKWNSENFKSVLHPRIKSQDLDCGDSICKISSLSMQMEIKSVSKVSRHFAFFVNVFLDFDAIIDFSLAMNSYGYEDIFSHSHHSLEKPAV